jgi:hypothetical protein
MSRTNNRRRRVRHTAWRWWRHTRLWLLASLIVVATASPGWAATPPPADPIDVRPSWNNIPGKSKILTLLDVTSQLGLACCVAAIVVGGAALGLGRLTGSLQSGSRGSGLVLGGGGGALLIIFAPRIVEWLIAS